MDSVQRLREPGEHPVDVPIICAITRFGLRGPRQLLPTYRDYRRVMAEARDRRPPGLLRSAFLIENRSTCYSLSIWSDPPEFSAAVPGHVTAARGVFGRLAFEEGRGPELWSTKWRLASVSNNLNWGDFDLRHLLAEQR